MTRDHERRGLITERKDAVDANKNSTVDVSDVKLVLITTLDVHERADRIAATTSLVEELPELDSLAAAALVAALEERFGITFDAEDLTEDVFATLASLTALVDSKLR